MYLKKLIKQLFTIKFSHIFMRNTFVEVDDKLLFDVRLLILLLLK